MTDYKNMISIDDYPGTFGAVIGDIYGSYYEFQYGPKTPKHEIKIYPSSCFTDDSVLTIAIADFLQGREQGLKKPVSFYLQKWARRYRNAGYGCRFEQYIDNENPIPYGSFGNGSAMRVSPVAYYAKSIEECDALATEVSAATHNHPEGIKGGVVIARCIYMALHGASRKEIEEYASNEYDLNLDYEYMVKQLGHGEEICQVTVPQALWCFLHSDSFDDCLRLCLHIRWDADTLAAIACPIAEAFYKEIPAECLRNAESRLPKDMLEILKNIKK